LYFNLNLLYQAPNIKFNKRIRRKENNIQRHTTHNNTLLLPRIALEHHRSHKTLKQDERSIFRNIDDAIQQRQRNDERFIGS